MTSEIKENEIDTSNEEVTHLEFIGDKASDYDHELSVSNENITLLKNFLYTVFILTYANLEDIVQYYEDKIKDEHYQKLIVELEQDMRSIAERFSLMVRMYRLKEKINYQPTNPKLDTNYAITEFVSRNIKYRGKELSSHMIFQTPQSEFH
ncbi:1958_t:CDS:2 [Funneliformis caledonium]|uniref:1958_t:CDS:1 n=1 Tax=Funneliformis caledonium TaxID=1117310 RepID=A0A9N8YRJ6_9GLOM|nr:1958_t:CDS:2 [Funneliformis caledonium]